MKKQILVIHGGEPFNSYDEYLEYLKEKEIDFERNVKGAKFWKEHLQSDLGDSYEVLSPRMPCSRNAKYLEWKIWMDKFIPYLQDGLILIGHSLGGIFLAKYLSENDLPIKIEKVFLVAAPFDDKDADYSLVDFILPSSLENFEKQAGKIYLYQSKDDPVVPFADVEKYAEKLPNAQKVIFEDKGHFNLIEFPEFIEKLKSL